MNNYEQNAELDISLISHNLLDKLEITPTQYYYELCKLEEKYTKETISKIINDTSYNCVFNGNHLHALVYLTGKLTNSNHKKNKYNFEDVNIEENNEDNKNNENENNENENNENENKNNEDKNENENNEDEIEEEYFYGKNNYIFEKLSIYILEKLITYDIDLFCLNKNNHTPLDCLFINSITSRTKNSDFVIKMKSYY